MKVQFEFSAADLAEVGNRAVARSPLVQTWRARAKWLWAVFLGAIVFLATSGKPGFRVAVALVFAVAFFIALGLHERRRGGNPRLLEFYRERLGGDGPFVCEVELTQDAVIARQLGTETRHAWSQVASILEVPGGIEFVYKPMGSMIVRDRAFTSAQARSDFLKLARRHVPAPVLLNGKPLP